MSITVDEFLRLKAICEPKRSLNLQVPLAEEFINEAVRRLPVYQVCRLEAAKNVSIKEWPTLVFPRKDGLGKITPKGVEQAVRHVYWKLARTVEQVAREKGVSEPAPIRLTEDGMRCPWCGRILVLPEGMWAKWEGQND